ncbi:MAG: alpha/beta hydrolase family protein, partial [bacterium]
MKRRTFGLSLLGGLLAGRFGARQLAAAPDTAQISKWLTTPVLDKDIAIDEVRAYCAKKIPRMPALGKPEDWTKFAAEHRKKVHDNVLFKGAAAGWRDAKGLKFERVGTLSTGGGYLLTQVRFEALPGQWIPAMLYEPAGLGDGKVPVHLAVNGHDAKGYAAPYKQERCVHLARNGVISLSLEWYGMGQFRTPEYLHPMINTIDLTGTSGIATHFLAMKRGIDVLQGLPNADPAKVVVSGLSGGGWQTIFISSLDPRVTLANPVAGYSSFLTRLEHDMDLGDSEQTPTDLATVTDYAIMTAIRAPQPTLLTFNAKDNCCFRADHALPPLLAAAKPVYDQLKAGDKLDTHVNQVPGDHNFLEDNRKALYRFM